MQGRRVPTTKGEFQSLCDLNEAATFFAKCGPWHKMDKKLVDIQNGGPDLMDEIMDAKCCAMKIKEPWLQRKHDVCGCHVRSKIRIFKKEENNRNRCNDLVEIRVEVDECVGRLVRPLHREVLRKVEKVTEHEWHKIAELVAEPVLEHVLDKSERAKGTSQSKEQKETARCLRCTREILFGFRKGVMWLCL